MRHAHLRSSRTLLASMLAVGLTLAATAGVAAKGAVTGVLGPFEPTAGEPVTVPLSLQMGGTPLPRDMGAEVVVVFTDSATGEEIQATASPSAAGGDAWQATVTFPHAATWTASAHLAFETDRVPFEELTGMTSVEVAAAPIAPAVGPPSALPLIGTVLAAMALLAVAVLAVRRLPFRVVRRRVAAVRGSPR